MTTYTLSWYTRKMTDGEWGKWIRHVKVHDDLEKAKVEYERLFNSIPDALGWQLESTDPASPYAPKHHKGKNTNAWKPRRYGK